MVFCYAGPTIARYVWPLYPDIRTRWHNGHAQSARKTRGATIKTLKHLALAALVVGGLLAGFGTQHATASPPDVKPPADPTIIRLEPDGLGALRVLFVDNDAAVESGFHIYVLDSNKAHLTPEYELSVPKVDGYDYATSGLGFAGLQPSTTYCIVLASYIGDGTHEGSVFSGSPVYPCATTLSRQANPAPAPTLPDFTVPTVGGEKNLTEGITSVYSIGVNNLGTRPQTQVQVSIQVTGSVEYVGMEQTSSSWTCSGTAPILCVGPLGGFGDAVQSLVATFQVRVRGAKAGIGTITVSADPNDLIKESNENNNSNQLVITVK